MAADMEYSLEFVADVAVAQEGANDAEIEEHFDSLRTFQSTAKELRGIMDLRLRVNSQEATEDPTQLFPERHSVSLNSHALQLGIRVSEIRIFLYAPRGTAASPLRLRSARARRLGRKVRSNRTGKSVTVTSALDFERVSP